MVGYYFLRAGTRKSFLCLSIIMMGLVALTGSSCNPKQSSHDAPPQTGTTTQESQSAQGALDFGPVIDSICRGDFEQARQINASGKLVAFLGMEN